MPRSVCNTKPNSKLTAGSDIFVINANTELGSPTWRDHNQRSASLISQDSQILQYHPQLYPPTQPDILIQARASCYRAGKLFFFFLSFYFGSPSINGFLLHVFSNSWLFSPEDLNVSGISQGSAERKRNNCVLGM